MRLELKTVDPLRTPLTSMATLDVSVGALFGIGMAVTTQLLVEVGGHSHCRLEVADEVDWRQPWGCY